MAKKKSRIRARGRYSARNRGEKTRAQRMAQNRIGTGTPKKPQRSIKSIRASNLKRIRDAAGERHAKFKQTRVQTFGGRRGAFSKSEQRRIKKAGYKVAGYSKARFKPTPKPKVNQLKTRDKLATTGYGLRPDGVTGEYKEGQIFNTGGKSGVDYIYKGVPGRGSFERLKASQDTQNQNLAWSPNFLKKSIIPNAAETGKNYLNNFRDENAADETKGLNKFFKNIQTRDKLLDQSSLGRSGPLITASDLTDLRGIMPAQSSYFGIKPSESFGYPSQAEVDEAAGITSGGLNIGGGGLNRLSKTRRGRTSRGRTSRGIRIGGSASAKPTVQEEVLLPVEQPVQTASTTPATTTGVNPNRLLEIQQQAYAQAYNPMLIGGYNPQFRFGAATPTIDYSTYFNY